MDIQEICFGDFCTIEQKRYVGPNIFYSYKVVGRKKSNVWSDVPVDANNREETRHDYIDDVVTVVCNNLDDRTVYQFRVSDLASVKKAQAVPEGFVVVNQKDLLELTIAINAVDLATHTESKTNEVREMWQQVALKLMALGTAQEQAND